MTNSLPILIVGAGPVGLSLALALTKQNIPTIVFEKDTKLNQEIRASTLHPATLELLAEWGVIADILAKGYQVDRLAYWERASKELIAVFSYNNIAADTPYPFRLQCPQHILTRTLMPHIDNQGQTIVKMGHTFIDYTQHTDYIEATFATADGPQTFRGRYLCGADGASSTVRQQTGMAFTGMTYADRFLLIGTDYDFGTLFPNFGPVNYIYDPQEWVIILRLPDIARVVFRLREDEEETAATQTAALQQRLWRFVGQKVPFAIKTIQVYKVHQRVAETFRQGRVLLLGDAAHINNPAGGLGLNSGIHDAHCLAQQLSAIYQGQATETQLDVYSQQRRAVALDSIRQYTDKNYQDLSATDETYRQRRNTQLQVMAADPAQARAYLLRASMLTERI